jgi:RNA polymerase sigma factor (sigma-70 family)
LGFVLSSQDSADLLPRLRAEEDAAYNEFVRRWHPWFERDLRKLGFTPADAYDLGFSCATHVLTKIETFTRSGVGFDGWVITVGRNFARDWHRKNVPFVDLPDVLVSPEADTSEDAEGRSPRLSAALDALSEALDTLSPDDKLLVEVAFLGGSANSANLAKELKITNSAARTRKSRILKRLRDLLEPDPRILDLL